MSIAGSYQDILIACTNTNMNTKKQQEPNKKRGKKENKGGRPQTEITEDRKSMAIEYVAASGFWKVRLAKFLKIDLKTLNKILEKDRGFSRDLEAADAVFVGNTIKNAKPEFILKSKYRDEFPDNTSDPYAGQRSEEFEAVIKRIRTILPASGQ